MHHDNDERSINAKYIAETIALDAEGKVGFPYADAYRLKSDLANKLVEVAREVNSGK